LLGALLNRELATDRLIELQHGAGDRHRGGRTVAILKFESGLRLVYKPHSLSVNVHFNELLHWCNQKGIANPFLWPKTLDRGTHGWVEFVGAEDCHSREEMSRFYHRMGASLALLYVLQATDCHSENLIAAGEHPVLIDLETLFHPTMPKPKEESILDFLRTTMTKSVLRTALLPQRMWTSEKEAGIDLSGIGRAGGQMSPPVLCTENSGTDAMRFIRQRVKMDGSHNRPRLLGQDCDPAEFTDNIVAGFCEVYELVCRNRDELLGEGSVLRGFEVDEIRVVVRPTRFYGEVLTDSYHPNVLRNALDRDRLLDCLWSVHPHQPHLSTLIPSEQASLRDGDVPFFWTRPGSRDLHACNGIVYENYLDEAPFTEVLKRIADLSPQDCSHQISLIRGSLATLVDPLALPRMISVRLPSGGRADRRELLAKASQIADTVLEKSVTNGRFVTWLGLDGTRNTWRVTPAAPDVYDGSFGTALFLGYLGEVIQADRYRSFAERTVNSALEHLQQPNGPRSKKLLGAFNGEAGAAHVLIHLGVLWKDSQLIERGLRLLEELAPFIDADQDLDVIAGTAGLLAVIASVQRASASGRLQEVGKLCVEHLLARAVDTQWGVGWRVDSVPEPLPGFAHGSAGMAHALLSFASDDPQQIQLAKRALGLMEGMNRPLEPSSSPDAVLRGAETWCHGACGVGLARLTARKSIASPDLDQQIQQNLETVMRTKLVEDDCLCHGNSGLLEFLFTAGRDLNDNSLIDTAYAGAWGLIKRAESTGWLCSTPTKLPVCGLMTGLAGIGYSLLRLAAPEKVPSILTLEPPVGWVEQ
jgi:type 2 lantibiotic biosynthesis protein LanM